MDEQSRIHKRNQDEMLKSLGVDPNASGSYGIPQFIDTPIEPRSEVRQMAHSMFEIYTSLKQAGFSPTQALYLLGQMMPNKQA